MSDCPITTRRPPTDGARRPRPLDADQVRLFRARPGGLLGGSLGGALRRPVLRPDRHPLGVRPAGPASRQDWARSARRSGWRAVARAGGHDLSPLAVRIYARIPAPGHTSRRRRPRRAGAAERAPRARSRSGRRRHAGRGLCGSWCGRSADAGTATNGGWCSSARAGTSAAGRSLPPPFPKRPGSGSSATRRASWPRSSPIRRAGSGSRPRPNGPRGVSALIRPRSRPWRVPSSRPARSARCWRRPRPIRLGASASTMPTCPPRCGSAWPRISGSRPIAAAIERMTEESRYYSKDSTPRVYAGDAPERRPMTDAMREAVRAFRRARLSRARVARLAGSPQLFAGALTTGPH